LAALSVGLAVLCGSSAWAQRRIDPIYPEAEVERGMGFLIGGGVTGFTNEEMTDFADPGGNWDARLIVGTRSPIGLELGYSGGAQNMSALGLDNDALLVTNGGEADLRFNFATGAWQPFALVGAAYKNYQLTRADFNTSAVNDSDNVLEVPLGLGLGYRMNALMFDLRGMFRPAFDGELVNAPGGGDAPSMHTWGARLNLGWEF